jgi:hypothetical protein
LIFENALSKANNGLLLYFLMLIFFFKVKLPGFDATELPVVVYQALQPISFLKSEQSRLSDGKDANIILPLSLNGRQGYAVRLMSPYKLVAHDQSAPSFSAIWLKLTSPIVPPSAGTSLGSDSYSPLAMLRWHG